MNPKIAAATIATTAALLMPAGAGAFAPIPYQPGNPTTNGCPSGWEALQVAALTPLGYGLPSRIDSLANGGNGDGVVCGKPVSSAEQTARFSTETVLIFDFRDNNLQPFAG